MKKFVVFAAMALATPALAQSINVDYGSNPASATPSASYGAAAGAAGMGTWNNIANGAGVTMNLLGLNGAATGVSLTGTGGLNFHFENPGTSGDDDALMDDLLDGAGTYTFSGLAAGTYHVYTYAWAPDSAAFVTNVAVAGGTALNPDTAIGGAWPGGFVAGVTHAHHSVNVAAGGSISITTTVGASFASLGGIQIVLIPAPAGLAVLGMGLISRRRRA